MNELNVVAGIDIGGSHITAGLIDLSTGAIIKDIIVRKRVNRYGTAEEILTTWCNAVRELWEQSGITGSRLGFAMPGPFDYKKGISLIKGFDKYDAVYQMNIREELCNRLGLTADQILFRNDAEAFLEGEVLFGAARAHAHAIGITLGTGLGSARHHEGVTTDAELSVLPYKGERIEDFVSTRGIIRNYERVSGIRLSDVRQIADLVNTDPHAREAFRLFETDLTWFLREFIQRDQPEVLVVGGNIANSWHLFSEALMKNLSATVSKMPVIRMAALGEHAALIGGAGCFIRTTA